MTTLGTHCVSAGHAGAAGETASSGRALAGQPGSRRDMEGRPVVVRSVFVLLIIAL